MNFLQQLRKSAAQLPPCRVIGIDLGTTNCTVAQVELPIADDHGPDGACTCIGVTQQTQSGPFANRLVPSVIAIDPEGKTWIGEGAKRMRAEPDRFGLSPEKNLFYEAKNEIGLRKRYHRAPEDYDRPRKISGHILRFLSEAAREASSKAVGSTVVTVPASFQLAQRGDTLEAASMAGLKLKDEDFLDEPVAALIDYLFTVAPDTVFERPTNIVVLDFGGGTCDVFLARLATDPREGLTITPRGGSRYHRLGGCDLDAVLIHRHLIPRLLQDNGLDSRYFEWTERKKVLEPALRGCAEALKEGICREISQLQLHGKYDSSDKSTIVASQMPVEIKTSRGSYVLRQPSLTAAEWEELAAPYFDTEALYCREEDYYQTQSIFSPLHDVLDRARVRDVEVDFVLLAGGSSLIPQVTTSLRQFLPGAKIERFPDSSAAQTAIARGAAWAAAWQLATGRPLVKPVTGSPLALKLTNRDPLPLVEAGTGVPYPADGSWRSLAGLTLPRVFTGELEVNIVAMPDEQTVLSATGSFPRQKAGKPLLFEYRLTAARVLECRFALADEPEQAIEALQENPLVNVTNPGAARLEIEQIEEELRDAGGLGAEAKPKLVRLATLYQTLRMREKAADVLKGALRVAGRPDPWILNLQALNYDSMGDYNRMEASYQAALKAGDDGAAAFNWALHCRRQQRYAEALAKADEAIFREPGNGPYHILRADLLKALGQGGSSTEAAEYGITLFPPPESQSDWQFFWYQSAIRLLGRKDLEQKAEAARQKSKTATADTGGQAPEYNNPPS